MLNAYCNKIGDIDISYLKKMKYDISQNFTFLCPDCSCRIKLTLCAWLGKSKNPYFRKSHNEDKHTCGRDDNVIHRVVTNKCHTNKYNADLYEQDIFSMTQEEFNELYFAIKNNSPENLKQPLDKRCTTVGGDTKSVSTSNSGKRRSPITLCQIYKSIHNTEEDYDFCTQLNSSNIEKVLKNENPKLKTIFWGEIKKISQIPSFGSVAYINLDVEDGFQYSFPIKNSTVEKKTELESYDNFAVGKKIYLFYDKSYKLLIEQSVNKYKIDKADLNNLGISQYLYCI